MSHLSTPKPVSESGEMQTTSFQKEDEMSRKTHHHHHSGHPSDGVILEIAVKSPPTEEQSRLTRLRAYDLWERDGRPNGDAARNWFWCEAEREMAASNERDE